MNPSNAIPSMFAILRNNAYRGTQVQILKANFSHSQQYFVIKNVEDYYYTNTGAGGERFRIRPTRLRTLGNAVYSMRFRNPDTNAIMDVKYWYLPFTFHNPNIPFLEFQYRSWIPRCLHYTPFTTDIGMNEIMRVIERIQEERLNTIRSMEDDGVPERAPFPIHHDYHSGYGQDDHDDRHFMHEDFVGVNRYRTRMPPPPPPPSIQPEVRIVQVEVPVERIIVQNIQKPLPKSVGDILLANARGGVDSCPIAAVLFKDCSKLSVTSCFHIFELESLSRWQENHTTCPVCRAKIENVVSE